MNTPKLLSARDIMTPPGIVLRPEMNLFRAIPIKVKHNITGCPVTDSNAKLLGILSELDCMKVIASDTFYADDYTSDILVSHYMTTDVLTIAADTGIFRIANFFFEHTLRRIPVLEEGRLIGQITRREVLKGIHQMRKDRNIRRKEYGAFNWPTSTISN
jgi:predicted transcriptional regulator